MNYLQRLEDILEENLNRGIITESGYEMILEYFEQEIEEEIDPITTRLQLRNIIFFRSFLDRVAKNYDFYLFL